MLGHRERRICAAIAKPVYPAEYIVFGSYFVGRDGDGGYVIGDLALDQSSQYIGGSQTIAYDDRTAVLLGRVGPQNDSIYFVDAQHQDDPYSITADASGAAINYNRTYASGAYDEVFPGTSANGDALRSHYGMTGTFETGFSSFHYVTNDTYVFDPADWESLGIPHVELFASRCIVAREKVRITLDGGSTTYALLSSEPTGHVDRSAARRLTTVPRIVVDKIGTGSAWTWSVKPYEGPLADGQYHRDGNGNLVAVTGVLLPSAEVATLNYEVMATTGIVESVGFHSTRVATVETTSNWLTQDIADTAVSWNANQIYVTRDDTSVGMDPIWSLYGGAVRINSQRQFSVSGNAWFTPKNGIFNVVAFLNDRWVRNLSEYPGSYHKQSAYPLVAP